MGMMKFVVQISVCELVIELNLFLEMHISHYIHLILNL